jgi:YD repeat-containing protein
MLRISPHGIVTNYSYDSNNRLIRKTYADGASDTFNYDGGEYEDIPKTRINARGITTNFQYDCFRQMTWFWDNGGPETYYAYDVYGRKFKETVYGGLNAYVRTPTPG